MRLSTRGRYGTRMLLDLALHGENGPVLLRDIARRQQLSLQYLEHLITPLIAAGLVSSTRGPRGGLSLAKSPREIKMSQIIQLLEGSMAPVECVTNPQVCDRSDFCAARDVWSEMKDAIDGILGSLTLEGLVEMQRGKKTPEGDMYFI